MALPPSKNGLINYIKRLKILSEIDNFKSFIFTDTEKAYPIKGFKIIYVRDGFLFSFKLVFLALKFKVRVLDIQYIYGQYGKNNRWSLGYLISGYSIISLLVLCRFFRIRSVLTMHSVINDLSKESVLTEMKRYSYLNGLIKLFNRLVILLSNSIVVLSDQQYAFLKDYTGRSKLHVVHHGIDSLNLEPEPHASFTFSYIGMIRPNKGVLNLLNAFQKLSEKYNNVELIILGGLGDSSFQEYENYFNAVKSKIKELQSNCNINFREGWVEERDILDALKRTDALVFPYVDNANEVSGVAFSYASAGIPYICSDIPRFNSSFSNNENALLVKCGSSIELFTAMEKLMKDPKLIAKISENLKAMWEKYNWEENAKAYYRIYRSLLK